MRVGGGRLYRGERAVQCRLSSRAVSRVLSARARSRTPEAAAVGYGGGKADGCGPVAHESRGPRRRRPPARGRGGVVRTCWKQSDPQIVKGGVEA